MESFRPGVMDRLGLAPAMLRARFPRLVVASISGYGQDGPDRVRAGHDVNYLARAGVLSLVKTPSLVPVQVADLAAGALPCALAICAALVGRQQTGQGATIDVSMTHQAYGLAAPSLAPHAAGTLRLAHGTQLLLGAAPCYDVYPTKDGHISVGALEPKFWHGLCDALHLPELKARALDVSGDVRAQLEQVFCQKDNAEWQAFFATRDVCVEVVHSADDVVADAQFPHVDIMVAGQLVRLPVPASALAGASPSTAAAPTLGAHNAEILGAAASVS
jgi:crotonobetainyl-CoA:carnitine CoA-transferase CaiB-like acyl-CoA transferase